MYDNDTMITFAIDALGNYLDEMTWVLYCQQI